jgi:hypothetical protein
MMPSSVLDQSLGSIRAVLAAKSDMYRISRDRSEVSPEPAAQSNPSVAR